MGPRGGPGDACPDLTIARIIPPVSNLFTALAALEIFDIFKSASESTENPFTENAEEKQISIANLHNKSFTHWPH